MKALSFQSLFRAAALSLVIFAASCTPEEDDNAIDARDNYTGSWVCTETGQNANATPFTITIEKSGSSSLEISNFNNLGKSTLVIASVSGSALSIGAQNAGGFSISGTGSLQNSKLNMSYTVDGDNINAVCQR
jgi:hypothetical protein